MALPQPGDSEITVGGIFDPDPDSPDDSPEAGSYNPPDVGLETGTIPGLGGEETEDAEETVVDRMDRFGEESPVSDDSGLVTALLVGAAALGAAWLFGGG